MRKLWIWLSHADADAPFARVIGAALEAAGARVSFSTLGDETVALMPRERYHLHNSRVLVLIASPSALQQRHIHESLAEYRAFVADSYLRDLIVVPVAPLTHHPEELAWGRWIGDVGQDASRAAAAILDALALGRAPFAAPATMTDDEIIWAARILLYQEREDIALPWLRRVVAARPIDITALYLFIYALNRAQYHDAALVACDMLLALVPEMAIYWALKGVILANYFRQYELALALYQRAVELHPGLSFAWYNQAVVYSRMGRHAEAIEAIERALLIEPEWLGAIRLRAGLFRDIGRNAESLLAVDSALQLDDEDIDALLLKSRILWSMGRRDEARSWLDLAYTLDPHNARIWVFISYTLGEEQRHQEALVAADRAISLDPHMATAWNNRGYQLFRLGRHEEALAALDQALRLDPTLKQAQANRDALLRYGTKAANVLDSG